jgi:hypothetical protein
MVAIADTGKQRITSTRPILKPTTETPALDCTQQAQDIPTLDRRVKDLHSLMGQTSKDMKEMKETLAKLPWSSRTVSRTDTIKELKAMESQPSSKARQTRNPSTSPTRPRLDERQRRLHLVATLWMR